MVKKDEDYSYLQIDIEPKNVSTYNGSGFDIEIDIPDNTYFEPESSFYNLPSIFLLEGKLDIGILEKSVDLILRKHDSLRTNFTEYKEGCPCQYVRKHENVTIDVVDMTSSAEEDVEHYLKGKTKEPFNLKQNP